MCFCRARLRSLSRTSKRLVDLTILEKAEHCVCLYDVPTLCIPGQVAPAFCTTGQRQTAASARTDRRDAVLSCGVAESPSLLPRPCEAEIEFICHEAFLMGICTCEREGTLVRVQCRSGIVRENRLEMFFLYFAGK